MANFLINNLFRIFVSTLNFVSPSILTDILLHPFDFATVLLQIGYDPEGMKYESATLVSVIVQYALFTFYIPYLLTSMQGLHFMGMPHPSIFYYVNYIYSKEGVLGCYRGLMPKICERLVMVGVNERVKRKINQGYSSRSSTSVDISEDDNFIRTLINSVCSQFFAVLASHPFHVLMVSSFAEFTYDKKSSILELSHSIYSDDGYFGFFTGLTARLLGEILSLIFSLTYTTVINKQMRPQSAGRPHQERRPDGAGVNLVNYVTDASRFTAFKQQNPMDMGSDCVEATCNNVRSNERHNQNQITGFFETTMNFMRNHSRLSIFRNRRLEWMTQNYSSRLHLFLAYIPLTSKLFYYIMIRDYLSKKISTPFFYVCHNAIVLDTGWDKFPLLTYIHPLVKLLQNNWKLNKRNRSFRNKRISNNSYL